MLPNTAAEIFFLALAFGALFVLLCLIAYRYGAFKKKVLAAQNIKKKNDDNIVQVIMASKHEPTVLLSLSGDIIFYNDAFYNLIGVNNINNYLKDTLFINKFINGTRKQRVIETTYDNRYFYVEMTRYQDEIFQGIIINYLDITLVKNSYIKQERFIKDLKHELRTPLTGIIGLSDLLARAEIKDNIELKKIYQTINNESLRINTMIEELTGNFESETKRELIDIDQLFIDLENVYRPQETTVKLFFRNYVDDNLISDYKLVKQVLINLINNALQYTVEGYISIKADNDENYIYLYVTDTGIGMDNKELALIFDRFYRVDESRNRHTGGNGLGLNIVKSILTKLNATINVQSKLNEGTTFTIRFNKKIK